MIDDAAKQELLAGLADNRISAIEWDKDDLVVLVRRHDSAGEAVSRRLRFVWVTGVSLELNYEPGWAGEPLLFESRASRTPDGQWSVVLDCAGAPRGGLSLICNDFFFDTPA